MRRFYQVFLESLVGQDHDRATKWFGFLFIVLIFLIAGANWVIPFVWRLVIGGLLLGWLTLSALQRDFVSLRWRRVLFYVATVLIVVPLYHVDVAYQPVQVTLKQPAAQYYDVSIRQVRAAIRESAFPIDYAPIRVGDGQQIVVADVADVTRSPFFTEGQVALGVVVALILLSVSLRVLATLCERQGMLRSDAVICAAVMQFWVVCGLAIGVGVVCGLGGGLVVGLVMLGVVPVLSVIV